MSQKYLQNSWQEFSKICVNSIFIQSNHWFGTQTTKFKKKFRNQTGAIAGIDGDHSRASIHLGRFALSKTNNYSNNQSKNDYIIALKRNQKKLFKPAVKISSIQLPLSESQTVDISHGRLIVRKVSVFDIEPLKCADFDCSQWDQIRSLVKV